jgi:hypothetical protein
MTYAMVLATAGALLLSAPALASPSHGQPIAASKVAFDNHGSRLGGDQDRAGMNRMFDEELHGLLHNPHCDPDDKNGPDGDHDDKAANNPGRGRHLGRCIGRPATP